MFTEFQQQELIRLGWAPQFDERLRITGFDRWVRVGEPIIRPSGLGKLIKYAALKYDQLTGEVVAEKFGVRGQ